jgi:hypothetical protein
VGGERQQIDDDEKGVVQEETKKRLDKDRLEKELRIIKKEK